MEMRGLGMGSSSGTQKVIPRKEAPPKPTGMLSAPNLVTSITKSMTAAATEIIEKFAHLNRVDDVADAAIQEHFQQRAAAQKFILAGAESSGQVSAFDRLGHWVQTPEEEEQWEPRPEMTPRKIQRGWQSSRAVGPDPPPF